MEVVASDESVSSSEFVASLFSEGRWPFEEG